MSGKENIDTTKEAAAQNGNDVITNGNNAEGAKLSSEQIETGVSC